MIHEGEFGRFSEALNRQLNSIEGKIDTGFARVNGTLGRHDDRLATLERQGCGQLSAHRATLDALGDDGGLSRRKQVGIAAGTGAGFVGLIELAKLIAQHIWK